MMGEEAFDFRSVLDSLPSARVLIRDDCPPDRIYLMDPSALGLDDENKVVVVPNEAMRETVADAMKRAGVVIRFEADPPLAPSEGTEG